MAAEEFARGSSKSMRSRRLPRAQSPTAAAAAAPHGRRSRIAPARQQPAAPAPEPKADKAGTRHRRHRPESPGPHINHSGSSRNCGDRGARVPAHRGNPNVVEQRSNRGEEFEEDLEFCEEPVPVEQELEPVPTKSRILETLATTTTSSTKLVAQNAALETLAKAGGSLACGEFIDVFSASTESISFGSTTASSRSTSPQLTEVSDTVSRGLETGSRPRSRLKSGAGSGQGQGLRSKLRLETNLQGDIKNSQKLKVSSRASGEGSNPGLSWRNKTSRSWRRRRRALILALGRRLRHMPAKESPSSTMENQSMSMPSDSSVGGTAKMHAKNNLKLGQRRPRPTGFGDGIVNKDSQPLAPTMLGRRRSVSMSAAENDVKASPSTSSSISSSPSASPRSSTSRSPRSVVSANKYHQARENCRNWSNHGNNTIHNHKRSNRNKGDNNGSTAPRDTRPGMNTLPSECTTDWDGDEDDNSSSSSNDIDGDANIDDGDQGLSFSAMALEMEEEEVDAGSCHEAQQLPMHLDEARPRPSRLLRAIEDGQRSLYAWNQAKNQRLQHQHSRAQPSSRSPNQQHHHHQRSSSSSSKTSNAVSYETLGSRKSLDASCGSAMGGRRSSGLASLLGGSSQGSTTSKSKRSSSLARTGSHLQNIMAGIMSLSPSHRRFSSTSTTSSVQSAGLLSSGGSAFSIQSASYGASGATGLGSNSSSAKTLPATRSFTYGSPTSMGSTGAQSRRASRHSHNRGSSLSSDHGEFNLDDLIQPLGGGSCMSPVHAFDETLDLSSSVTELRRSPRSAAGDFENFIGSNFSTAAATTITSSSNNSNNVLVARRGSTNAALSTSAPNNSDAKDGWARHIRSWRQRRRLQDCELPQLIFLFKWYPQFARMTLIEAGMTPEGLALRKPLCSLLLAKLWNRPETFASHRWALTSLLGHALLKEFQENKDTPLRSTSVAATLLTQLVAQPACVQALKRAILPEINQALEPAQYSASNPITAAVLADRILDAIIQTGFPVAIYDVCQQIGRLARSESERIALVGGCFIFLRYVNPAITDAAINGPGIRNKTLMNAARLLQAACSRASIVAASDAADTSNQMKKPHCSSAATTVCKNQEGGTFAASIDAYREQNFSADEIAFIEKGIPKIRTLIAQLCKTSPSITFKQSVARAETLIDLHRALRIDQAGDPIETSWRPVALSIADMQLLARAAIYLAEGNHQLSSCELDCAQTVNPDVHLCSFRDAIRPRLSNLRSFAGSQKDTDNLYLQLEPRWVRASPVSLQSMSPDSSPQSSAPSSPSSDMSEPPEHHSLEAAHLLNPDEEASRNLRHAYETLLLL